MLPWNGFVQGMGVAGLGTYIWVHAGLGFRVRVQGFGFRGQDLGEVFWDLWAYIMDG